MPNGSPGTVGGLPIHAEGAQLVVNGRTYLLDVGVQALRQMGRLGLAVPSVTAVFLMHVVPGALDVKDLPGRIARIRQGYDGKVVVAEDLGRS